LKYIVNFGVVLLFLAVERKFLSPKYKFTLKGKEKGEFFFGGEHSRTNRSGYYLSGTWNKKSLRNPLIFISLLEIRTEKKDFFILLHSSPTFVYLRVLPCASLLWICVVRELVVGSKKGNEGLNHFGGQVPPREICVVPFGPGFLMPTGTFESDTVGLPPIMDSLYEVKAAVETIGYGHVYQAFVLRELLKQI
jgi:hypothetical protein